jgi:starch synthase
MVAAENGALTGGKVGGIGDVIRDVPRALARRGHRVTVVTPGYQSLSKLEGARRLHSLTVEFCGALETLDLFQVDVAGEPAAVRHLVLEHPLFAACGAGSIYCHDLWEPFATDASKFALLSQAACYALAAGAIDKADVLHLHDWHAAPVLILRSAHRAYRALQDARTVYSVHNLSLQGVRPLADNWSSLGHWFPGLRFSHKTIVDPRYADCVNLMRAGINLADRVHVVSPTYAREVLEPSDATAGWCRGEGLEADLRRVDAQGRLHGILNGCEYPVASAARRPTRKEFIAAATTTLEQWVNGRDQISAAHYLAQQRLLQWAQRHDKEPFVVGSVGRLTPQKVSLLMVETTPGVTALDVLLCRLDKRLLIVLGSGDAACERFMREAMQRHSNLLFLCGYSEELGELLYRFCDLFLMPSSFEPCGISQMLAMRAGTPPLVHKVGGLADTVQHGVNGFTFEGADRHAQAADLLRVFDEALPLKDDKAPVWGAICRNAAAARFSWDTVVQDYETRLYR